MKNYLLLLLLVFASKANIAQQWLENMPTKRSAEYTLKDYQTAFYKYCSDNGIRHGYYVENGEAKKAPGWKQFKRWEHMMEMQANPTTGAFPELSHLAKRESQSSRSAAWPAIYWTQQGPSEYTTNRVVLGRLNCIAFHPTDSKIYWVGSAGGGLWMTKDAGSTWKPLTDNLNSLGISDIAVASADTLYIATGDREYSFLEGISNRSVGVYKSTNGGASWSPTGTMDSLEFRNGLKINKLLINPKNSSQILAATNAGLYRSINAGRSWTYITDLVFRDLEANADGLVFGSTSARIWWSTQASFGTSWTRALTTNGRACRIELAISTKSASTVYALAATNTTKPQLLAIYKSVDFGKSYTEIYSDSVTAKEEYKNLLGWKSDGTDRVGQGNYDLSLAVSNTDANKVYVGGINTWVSTDGGKKWSLSNHWTGTGATEIHADKHMLRFNKNGDLFECNDGGLAVLPVNGSWTNKSAGLNISQIYNIGLYSKSPVVSMIGLQDNGLKKLEADRKWSQLNGGDVTECFFDPNDDKVKYFSMQEGGLRRFDPVLGMDANWKNTISPKDQDTNGAWVTPFIMDPKNSSTLYSGYVEVYRSTDRGASWTIISNLSDSGLLRVLKVAPSNTKVMYASGLKNIWVTLDNTAKKPVWTDITSGLNIADGIITDIEVKETNSGVVWVTIGGFGANHVYETKNLGKTWTDITGSLPKVPAYTIVHNKQAPYDDQLYVGTEYGVYFKNGSDDWARVSYGLPNVNVQDLEIYYDKDPSLSLLKAATFGRGVWQSHMANICKSPVISGPGYVCLGGSARLTVSIPGGTWKSGSTSIATISAAGDIKTVKPGYSEMSYTLARKGCATETASKYFTVGEPIKNLTIDGSSMVMSTKSIDWKPSNPNGSWSSDNSGIASVRKVSLFGGFISYGTVTGVNPGTTNITYTVPVINGCPGMTVRKSITVIKNVEWYKPEAAEETGISEKSMDAVGKVYPNPSSGVLYYDNSSGLAKTMTLIEISGKEIATLNLSQGINYIEFGGIESGVYLVRVSGDSFSKISKIAFVK